VIDSDRTDFLINSRCYFEIAGRSKGYEQIKNLTDSFIAVDNVERGFGNKIPLWLFVLIAYAEYGINQKVAGY
jgi:hypothetical protein